MAAPGFVAMSLLPVSVFFITLERILILRLGTNFSNSTKTRTFHAHLGSSGGCLALTTVGFTLLFFTISPDETSKHCKNCIFNNLFFCLSVLLL